MGVIRGSHTAPGVYTKNTAIRTDIVNTDLLYKNTKYMSIDGRNDERPYKMYFGYYPLKSENGIFTEEKINTLLDIPIKDIIESEGIQEFSAYGNKYHINDGEDIVMTPFFTEQEVRNLIQGGTPYSQIADDKNNCILLIVPTYKIITELDMKDDTLMYYPISDKFNELKIEPVKGIRYTLFAMFNNSFAYSRICRDKVISPLTIHIARKPTRFNRGRNRD